MASGREALLDALIVDGWDSLARRREALSLRAVARAVSISPTSVYLYFPDRDALVLAAMQRCHEDMLRAADEAEAAQEDPASRLRARILTQAGPARATRRD